MTRINLEVYTEDMSAHPVDDGSSPTSTSKRRLRDQDGSGEEGPMGKQPKNDVDDNNGDSDPSQRSLYSCKLCRLHRDMEKGAKIWFWIDLVVSTLFVLTWFSITLAVHVNPATSLRSWGYCRNVRTTSPVQVLVRLVYIAGVVTVLVAIYKRIHILCWVYIVVAPVVFFGDLIIQLVTSLMCHHDSSVFIDVFALLWYGYGMWVDIDLIRSGVLKKGRVQAAPGNSRRD